jgi:hypothetical protein
LLPVFLGIAAAQLFRASYQGVQLTRAAGYLLLLISVGVILSVIIDSESARDSGGIVGGFLKESVLVPLFGSAERNSHRFFHLATLSDAADTELATRLDWLHQEKLF